MNKTTIPWALNPDGTPGYTWNPLSGCLNHDNGLCKMGGFPCYAYRLANTRLRGLYWANNNLPCHDEPDHDAHHADPFYPRFWKGKVTQPFHRKKPAGIFTCDMADLFGIGVPAEWTENILQIVKVSPQHRFYLLTKQPQNLVKFGPFPDNAWVGVTVTNNDGLFDNLNNLYGISASIKYLSLEPLLGRLNTNLLVSLADKRDRHLDWVIIGACTGTESAMRSLAHTTGRMSIGNVKPWGKKWTLQPDIEWVREIVDACDQAGIPVFLKDNLSPLIADARKAKGMWGAPHLLRQEMPQA